MGILPYMINMGLPTGCGGCGGGGGAWAYSEFCLLHRLGLFLSILNFTIMGVWGKSGYFFFGIGHLQVFFDVTFKTGNIFWGSIKILCIFWDIARIGVRTFCCTDRCFYLVLTALFLLSISPVPLK